MSDLTRTTSYTIKSLEGASAKLSPDDVSLSTKVLPPAARAGQKLTVTVTLEDVHPRLEWAKAYAVQGQSDLKVYELLGNANPPLASCHRLHYLQMASEKIAKAWRLQDPHDSLSSLLKSHVATGEFIRKYLSSAEMRRRYMGRNEQLDALTKAMKRVASEIEQLAPAVDREKVPHNVEYPWSDGVRLTTPCQSRFAIEDMPPTSIPDFLKILREASDTVIAR